MSFDEGEAVRPPHAARYPEEDTSVTTPRELNGWYSYAIAAEVFAVVGTGSFLPVTLEQLAREQGVFFKDRSRPCVGSGSGSAGNPSMLRIREPGKQEQCLINIMGSDVTTASFAMYTFSAAVFCQAVTLVCFSSFADHGPYRKRMLLTFAYAGSLASTLFILITPSVFFLAPILVIVAVASLGCSFTLLNAFLPLLVSYYHDPFKFTSGSSSSDELEMEALNPSSDPGAIHVHRTNPEKLARELALSSKISSKGVGLGYMASAFVQVVSIIIIYLFSKTKISEYDSTLPMRVILFLIGIWWAAFSIPTLLWLRPRPGPQLPVQSRLKPSRLRTFLFYLGFSLSSFWTTLRRAIKLRQTFLFLVAWFLLSDSIATISGTAVLFARTELDMEISGIAILSITTIAAGIVGAFSWPRIATKYNLSTKQVMLRCVLLMVLVPLYGMLGFLPPIEALGFFGLQQQWEIYPLGALHGFIMGGISSYARSVYSPLIPEGYEAAFFALYAVTDKGSSAVGPALVGWIVDRSGSIRPAFVFLAIMSLLPGPLLWALDMEKGREDAARMAASIRKTEAPDAEDDMRERF